MLAARREETAWVHSEGVYEIVPMQECRDAGMKPLDLIWVDTDKSVDPAHKKIRSRLCAKEYKTKKQGKIQRTLPASQLFSQPLNDVWDATNWDGLCGTPWQMVALELKLTKKVTSGKEREGPPCQGM